MAKSKLILVTFDNSMQSGIFPSLIRVELLPDTIPPHVLITFEFLPKYFQKNSA